MIVQDNSVMISITHQSNLAMKPQLLSWQFILEVDLILLL